MAALKIVREAGAPGQDPDNVADAEGYLSLLTEVRDYIIPKAGNWNNVSGGAQAGDYDVTVKSAEPSRS